MTLKLGELFAGYSGLGMGVAEVLDVEPVWFSEFDAAPSKILAHRFPGVPNHGDITRIDWSQVEPVDVLTGGFPCQDLSLAGRRKGMRSGTRSGLWSDFLTAIKELRPRLVIIENVRGLLSGCAESDLESCPGCVGDGQHRPPLRALGRVLGDLAGIGFDAEWGGVLASDVGAPHGRFRVFVVAWPADAPCDLRWLRDGDGVPTRIQWGDESPLLRTPVADEDGGGPLHPDTARERGQTLRLTGQILAMTGDLLPTPSVADVQGGRKHRSGARSGELLLNGIAAAEAWGPYAPAIARWASVRSVPAPAPTEPGTKGRARLSPRFVEWMMGLPPGWVTDVPGLTRSEQLKALGNGVVPQQAAHAIRGLLRRAMTEGA